MPSDPNDDANPLRSAVQSKQETHAVEGEADAQQGASGDEVRVNVRVRPDLHERFKARAQREGRPISWLIRRFMEHYAGGGDVPSPTES